MAEEHTTLEPLTFDSIVQTMVDFAVASQQDTDRPLTADDFLEGSVFLSIFEGVANPIEYLMYALLVDLPARFFLNQATGSALDRLVDNFTFGQVVRVPASMGAGGILIEADPQTSVPINVELRAPGTANNPTGVLAKTLVAITVPTGDNFASSAAAATTVGSNTNLAMGLELQMPNPVAGVIRITTSEQWTGGADEQSDASLRDAVIEFLDSLAKAVRPAIILGARQSGYETVVVCEPGTGRVVVFVDDGQPVSPAKLDVARVNIHRFWKAAGARLNLSGPEDVLVTINAKAFSDGVVPLVTVQANIEAAWASLFGGLLMGSGLDRVDDLLRAAATAVGYNGVNIDSPASDIAVVAPLDEYWTEWPDTPNSIRPYQKLKLAAVVWS